MGPERAAIAWYVARDGQQFGPISEQELRDRYLVGQVAPDDVVWREGFAEWRPAASILGIPPQRGTIPPPPPPPSPNKSVTAPNLTEVPGETSGSPKAATAGTTTGIIAIIFAVLGLIPPVGIVFALIGLALGFMARARARTVGNILGSKLGAIAVGLSMTTFAIVSIVLAFVGSNFSSLRFASTPSLRSFYGAWECGGKYSYAFEAKFIRIGSEIIEDYKVWESDGAVVAGNSLRGVPIRRVGEVVYIMDRPCQKRGN